jgi:hypothetical protein
MNELKAFLWRHPDLSKKVKIDCLMDCVRKELAELVRGYVFNTPDVIEHIRHRTIDALDTLVARRELRNFRVSTDNNHMVVELTVIAPVQDIKATFSITP